jgi:ubiquinone/menaquinone biosynthesis C-methylase UbiE
MTPNPTSTSLTGFASVDSDPEAHELIAALDEQAALPAVQRLRAAATELLAVRSGHRLVEVGCGTGDVARALARLVGPDGAVIGIEPSHTMLAEARRRTHDSSLPVEFRQGDITRLDLENASVDGTHCERVFQHLDPAAVGTAIGELVRVTRPGGRIVVVDTDWGMHAIHGADHGLTSRVVECWASSTTNAWSGRSLPSVFAEAGLRAPVVVAETLTSADPLRPTKPPITTMAATAVRAGALAADDAHAWLEQLADAGARGLFFWAVTMFAVAGVRP